MDVKSDFKASTQHGNIHMRYNKEPNNTLLKLNPENGNAHVNNKMFIDGKVEMDKMSWNFIPIMVIFI